MIPAALLAVALAATPPLPADPGYPVNLDQDVDWGHVAASLASGPTAFYTTGGELHRANLYRNYNISGGSVARNPETDDQVLVFDDGDKVSRTDPWGNGPLAIGEGTLPEVDRLFATWGYRWDSLLLWEPDAFHPGNTGKLDLLPDIRLAYPTVWDSQFLGQVVFSKYERRDGYGQLVEYGVMANDPQGNFAEMVRSPPLANGWESFFAFIPHSWEGRTAWVGDNDVFLREWDTWYAGSAFEAFMNGKDIPLKLGLCKQYFFPRVGGEKGRFVLFTGEYCDDGDRVLYLHDTWSGKTWFVTNDVGSPRTMSDWFAAPYDIRDDVIVYLAPGKGKTDVWLFDIDVNAL
jgi:hypothetical protein